MSREVNESRGGSERESSFVPADFLAETIRKDCFSRRTFDLGHKLMAPSDPRV